MVLEVSVAQRTAIFSLWQTPRSESQCTPLGFWSKALWITPLLLRNSFWLATGRQRTPNAYPWATNLPCDLSSVKYHVTRLQPWCDLMKMTLPFCDLSKNHNPSTAMRKMSDQVHIPLKRHPENYLTSTLQNCEGPQKQKKSLRNYHSPKETWQLNVLWCPGWDPGAGRDIRWKEV